MATSAGGGAFSSGKLSHAMVDDLAPFDGDVAPLSTQSTEGPGRLAGRQTVVDRTRKALHTEDASKSAVMEHWTKAKEAAPELDGMAPHQPPAEQQWSQTLTEAQQIAKEERMIQNRLEHAGLTFNELWAANERDRSTKTMSDAGVVKRDIRLVGERMRKSKRGLINPNSNSMQSFDLLTLLALGFTVIVTPYEIGLVHHSGPALVLTNFVVNSIFAIGMVLQFFIPYREDQKVGGQLVKRHSRIALHYLKGPFFVDLVSTIPYELIAEAVASGSDTKTLRLLRMLRAVRLLKLGRLFRASRILTRLADLFETHLDFSVSHATRTVGFWTVALLVLIHWFVCFWCLLCQLRGSQRTDELIAAQLATDGECEAGEGDCLSECEVELLVGLAGRTLRHVQNGENWICHAKANGGVPQDVEGSQHWQLYVFVLGADVSGPGFVSATSTPEYATNFVFQFVMLIISNIFVGVVATAQSEADPQAKAFKARMDHLNHFLADVNAPMHLKKRTREYVRSCKDLVAKQSFGDLYDLFCPKLRGDVLEHISHEILANVNFFNDCEAGFMREISQKLKHYGYEAGDYIKCSEPTLCVVTRGTAVLGGKPITMHQYWGEDVIVSSHALRDTRNAST